MDEVGKNTLRGLIEEDQISLDDLLDAPLVARRDKGGEPSAVVVGLYYEDGRCWRRVTLEWAVVTDEG